MTSKNKIPKKPRDEAVNIMLSELKGMTWTFILCNTVVLLGCSVYSIVAVSFDWRMLTGLTLGNLAALANFYALGAKSARIIREKDAKRAKKYATSNYFIRYFTAFAVFGFFTYFNIINPVVAVIPLFYTKIHYTIKAIKNTK
ncbi:MAG: hypothetical protein FWF94_01875 [Oscillospiraceae bacterium]|nr:hypothetical protein [Oscillospiraceae bacterium]